MTYDSKANGNYVLLLLLIKLFALLKKKLANCLLLRKIDCTVLYKLHQKPKLLTI